MVAAGRSTSASSSTRKGPAPPSTAPVATTGSPNHAASAGSSGCHVPTTRSRRGPSPSCSSTRSPTARPSVAGGRGVQGGRRGIGVVGGGPASSSSGHDPLTSSDRPGTPSSASSTAPSVVPSCRASTGAVSTDRLQCAPYGTSIRSSTDAAASACASGSRATRICHLAAPSVPVAATRPSRRPEVEAPARASTMPVPKPVGGTRRRRSSRARPRAQRRARTRSVSLPRRSPRDVGPGARGAGWCRAPPRASTNSHSLSGKALLHASALTP